ncbi:hypothetical protein RND71_012381 [Anisodus tanguticus]|uniref:Uncharacterized protein n=1 Tax=Anisodus tanguticus TaxID=243964 RepID=A0AAE1VPQ4_9SOLA|nr:hypothetical protein RND71_012381 [Anisodus tanguticus]
MTLQNYQKQQNLAMNSSSQSTKIKVEKIRPIPSHTKVEKKGHIYPQFMAHFVDTLNLWHRLPVLLGLIYLGARRHFHQEYNLINVGKTPTDVISNPAEYPYRTVDGKYNSMEVQAVRIAREEVQGYVWTRWKFHFGRFCGNEDLRFHGVPYPLIEEFVSVYRMHQLLPDKLQLRNMNATPGPNKSFPLTNE